MNPNNSRLPSGRMEPPLTFGNVEADTCSYTSEDITRYASKSISLENMSSEYIFQTSTLRKVRTFLQNSADK